MAGPGLRSPWVSADPAYRIRWPGKHLQCRECEGGPRELGLGHQNIIRAVGANCCHMRQNIHSMNMEVPLNVRVLCTLDPACLPSCQSPFQDAEWLWSTLTESLVHGWSFPGSVQSPFPLWGNVEERSTYKCKYRFLNPRSAVFKLIKITQNTYSSLLFCCSNKKKMMAKSSPELSSHSPWWRELKTGT